MAVEYLGSEVASKRCADSLSARNVSIVDEEFRRVTHAMNPQVAPQFVNVWFTGVPVVDASYK